MEFIRMFRNISIRNKLILIFLLVILFTSASVSFFSYKASENTIKTQSGELISGYLEQTVKRFDLFMENIHRATMSIAFNKDLIKMLNSIGQGSYDDYNNLLRITDIITTFNNTNRFIYLMDIYDFRNNTVIHSRALKSRIDLKSKEYSVVKSLYIDNKDAFSINYIWMPGRQVELNGTSKNVMTFTMPIKNNLSQTVIGCIMTYLPDEYVRQMCNELSDSSGGDVVITDNKSKVIVSSNEKNLGQNYAEYTGMGFSQKDNAIRDVSGNKSLVTLIKSKYMDWSFLSIVPMKTLMEKNTSVLKNTFILISIITIFVAFLLSFIMNAFFYKPMKLLIHDIKIHGAEESINSKYISQKNEIGFLFKSFNDILVENKILAKNTYEQKIQLRDSEIRLLHSQINPHFLYNSLDSIIWMLMFKQYDDIKNLVKAMIQFFRMSLTKGNEIVYIKQVKEQLESYFVIQKIRYSDRLKVEINFEESILEFRMLKLLLQPIVENSIYHGIEKKPGVGFIKVIGGLEAGLLHFKVEDNGVGVSTERLEEINEIVNSEKQSQENFYALQNINQRIKLFYGSEYGIKLESHNGEGMAVSITIPVIK